MFQLCWAQICLTICMHRTFACYAEIESLICEVVSSRATSLGAWCALSNGGLHRKRRGRGLGLLLYAFGVRYGEDDITLVCRKHDTLRSTQHNTRQPPHPFASQGRDEQAKRAMSWSKELICESDPVAMSDVSLECASALAWATEQTPPLMHHTTPSPCVRAQSRQSAAKSRFLMIRR